MLYSFNQGEPQELPFKIQLSNGQIRTDPSSFTDEEIADAGYVFAGFKPEHNTDTQKATWNGSEWVVSDKTAEEIKAEQDVLWNTHRSERDDKINSFEWRISRYLSEVRQGINPTTDDIAELDAYVNALRNLTNQSDPNNIVWPTEPE